MEKKRQKSRGEQRGKKEEYLDKKARERRSNEQR